MDFGKYAVLEPLEHNFKKEPDWYWRVNPPTSRDELELSRFITDGRVIQDKQGGQRIVSRTIVEIMLREIALTFAGTNLPKNEEGDPVLTEKASVSQIENVLRQMPNEMVKEIWEFVGDHVKGWGPGKNLMSPPETDESESEA